MNKKLIRELESEADDDADTPLGIELRLALICRALAEVLKRQAGCSHGAGCPLCADNRAHLKRCASESK